MKGGNIMKKHKNIRVFVIVFSLLVLFTLPCISFATSFSDIRPGNADITLDNHLKMNLDSRGSDFSDYTHENYGRPHIDGGHYGLNHHQPTATPIPNTAWLLGIGLVGLIGINRKLQK
jgi:hypothetical protein